MVGNDWRSHRQGNPNSSSSGNSINKCNTIRVILTAVVLVILLTNVTVSYSSSCYWNDIMYVHCPTHLCEQCGSPRTVNSTAYTNCIQLETISYYTDVMLVFHHFLFKVVIKQDGYAPALDNISSLIFVFYSFN